MTPPIDCAQCPRLVAYRTQNQAANPHWHNGPVTSFGPISAQFLFVGLAPGLRGANRTNRPFTGDFAGDLLYPSLVKFGLASGVYGAEFDDGLTLINTRISNAVRCVPPENKPTPAEFKQCRPFLVDEMKAMKNLRGIFAIGRDGHDAVLGVLGLRKSQFTFAHGAVHQIGDGLILTDSYHCSRYNTNTGRLTTAMFHQAIQNLMDASA